MSIKANILEAIGNTPLVRLNKVIEPGSAELLVKCEYMNPAGSIKDRMALYIIEQAEKEGLLKPGGTIVENTSGNTGLGVAMTAAVKGYRCVFTMPDKMSLEKVNMLKSFGCEVVITPTDVPGDSPDHYVNVAKRIAKETPGSYYLDQYHNQWNIDAHYHSTGREIWEETQGQFDAFVAGTGTGGTVSGVGRYIKDQLAKGHGRAVKVVGVDPLGSVHYHYFHTGTIPNAYVYKVEGIGEDIKCKAFDTKAADEMRQVNDQESFDMARRLVREEGLFCGGSSGSIVHVAVQIAREMGEGKTVIAVLPDSGTRYITKYLSDAWMKDHGFSERTPAAGLVEDLLSTREQNLITANESATLESLVHLLRDHGVSQVPITNGDNKPIGIVHEVDLLRALHLNGASQESPASTIAQPIGGLIYPKARIEELYHIFETDQVAIVVDNSQIAGVISQIDLIEYLSRK
jgi:cystathionine beta-synthase